jgi:predicted amidohydrolase
VTVYQEFVMAAVQAAPVYFDREASTEKACRLIAEAGARGATIAAFGECWLPGYPFFTFSRPTQLWWHAAAEYLANGVEIPGPETDRLCEAALAAGIDVVIGVAERDAVSQGTIYCTLLFIGREGTILGRHRKIKPTHHERAVWGEGDAVGLVAHQRSYARISGLNCWEHNSVLPGYVLMAQGTQIHVAAWPGREVEDAPPAPISIWPRQTLLSRAFASQSGAYVIMVGGLCRPEDIPDRYHELIRHPYTGNSAIIDPRGEIIAGPVEGEEILLAPGSMEAIYAAKIGCDTGGHYSRPDLIQVLVNRRPLERLVEMPEADDGRVVSRES